jgi:hypothetical protein
MPSSSRFPSPHEGGHFIKILASSLARFSQMVAARPDCSRTKTKHRAMPLGWAGAAGYAAGGEPGAESAKKTGNERATLRIRSRGAALIQCNLPGGGKEGSGLDQISVGSGDILRTGAAPLVETLAHNRFREFRDHLPGNLTHYFTRHAPDHPLNDGIEHFV